MGGLPETRERTWFILKVTPQAEAAVARRIKRRLGGTDDGDDVVSDLVSTFVARARWEVRHRGKSIPRERIVLPGYLFAGFALDAGLREPPWFDLRDVAGLTGVLACDGVPRAVAATDVGEIIARCDSGFYNPKAEPLVQRGMRVVARGGQFRGIEGDVIKVDKGLRHADVVMEMLGSLPVRLRLDHLVSVSYSEYSSASDDRLHSAA